MDPKTRYKEKLKSLHPGQNTYQGVSCKRGHDGLRYVNGGKCVQCMKERVRNPSDKIKALKWHKDNPERSKELNKKWHKDNPQKAVARVMNRRAIQLQRTPKWADLKKIEEFYLNCPEGMEVDHIVPLQGKLVSGFHIEYNLQYLSRAANAAKSNRFDPETFI